MGAALSRANSKLSFGFDEYLRDREDLAESLREIARSASALRRAKGTLRAVTGASGVAAGVAGGVALALSPATLGLGVPAAAVAALVITSHSISAASHVSSVASYCHDRAGDDDITLRLRNVQFLMDSVQTKDEEVNEVLKALEKENVEPVVQACERLRNGHVGDKLTPDKEKKPSHVALDLVKSQGIFMVTRSLARRNDQEKGEEELEKTLEDAADSLDEETATLRTLTHHFHYFCCVGSEAPPPRGLLTYVDGGGGCWRTMVVTYFDTTTQKEVAAKSDNSKIIRLPSGATSVKVHFVVKGGRTVKKIDRPHPKQPWVRTEKGECQVDEFEIDSGDGVDAVFYVEGSLTHSFVKKAWDFGSARRRAS